MTRLEPAMLIHRVEPIYPTLMKQIRREGRVELRAIIATDGSIESLQVVAGDAGFYQSALDAVRQWRYRPTVLNGQPVEIDTFITVIYTMQHDPGCRNVDGARGRPCRYCCAAPPACTGQPIA